MLEIFLVGYLARTVGGIAIQKGLKPGRWKAYTILLWIGLELIGIFAAVLFMGGINVLSLLVVYGLPGLGHFILRQNLKKRPDVIDNWINEIGTDSAEPLPVQQN